MSAMKSGAMVRAPAWHHCLLHRERFSAMVIYLPACCWYCKCSMYWLWKKLNLDLLGMTDLRTAVCPDRWQLPPKISNTQSCWYSRLRWISEQCWVNHVDRNTKTIDAKQVPGAIGQTSTSLVKTPRLAGHVYGEMFLRTLHKIWACSIWA